MAEKMMGSEKKITFEVRDNPYGALTVEVAKTETDAWEVGKQIRHGLSNIIPTLLELQATYAVSFIKNGTEISLQELEDIVSQRMNLMFAE